MNNNLVIGVIAVIVLVAGAWFFTSRTLTAPTTEPPTAVDTNTYTDTTPTTEAPVATTTKMTDHESMVPATTTSPTASTNSSVSTVDSTENTVRFRVEGQNFSFDIKEITVKKGQTVTIEFVNVGGMHDWVLDEFAGARTSVIKTGETATITFVADTVGTFQYYCSVSNHRARGMVGTFIVKE